MAINVEEAIKDLQEDINEKQGQIDLIKSIDWSNPVDEDIWHEICETPLRSSDLLGVLVKNIFPEADDINVHCNYVYFKLYGYRCALPTSRCRGAYVETCWYKKDSGEPKEIHFGNNYTMKKYFDEKDNDARWTVLFDYRLPNLRGYRKWIKFILWFGKYKWKDDNRSSWEEEFEKDKQRFEKRKENYQIERKEMHEKVEIMVNKLIPELKKFSDKVYKLDGYSWIQVEDMVKLEGFSL